MAILLLLLLALPIFIILVLPTFKNNTRSPPGPRGLPFIGNLHQLDPSKLHLCLSQLSNKYGPLMSLRIGQVPIIVISSAKVAKQALKDNDLAFAGRPYSTSSSKLTYKNLDIVSSPYTPYWREMRKVIVLHLFTHKQVRSFRPFREDEVSKMVQEIAKQAESRRVIDMSEIIMSFSTSLVCRVAFGKRFDEENGVGKRRFDELFGEIMASSVDIFLGDFFPKLRWVDRISGKIARLDRVFKEMDSFLQELIDEHLSPTRPESMNGDILDLLIQLKEDTSSVVCIDWNHIKALLMNVFVAGTDTAASAITWAMSHCPESLPMTALIKNPRSMKKLQLELRTLIGKKGRIHEDDIENLPYLQAVVKETLRMYPPAPLLVPKETTESCTIDEYVIRPKSFVYVNAWAIGRDPEYWENPDEFFPERFLNSTISFKGQDFGFIPFGTGRRICPGMGLGVAAVEMALANLLYLFDWELPEGLTEADVDTDTSQGLTMHKKNPLCLVAKGFVSFNN